MWQNKADCKPSSFSHEFVERERQWTAEIAASAPTAQLRLVLARYADLLALDIEQRARDRIMIRGSVCYEEFQRRSGRELSVMARIIKTAGDEYRRLTHIPELEPPKR